MNKRKGLSLIIVLLWMILIFSLSAQSVEKSNNLSKGITEEIVKKVGFHKAININRMNHLLRKNAHFFAYFILGILTMIFLKSVKIIGYKGIILSLSICIIYAISDELHQLFVPGRGAQIKDIIIDSAGSVTGILIYILFNKSKKNIWYN